MLDQTTRQQGKLQQQIIMNIQLKDMLRYEYKSLQSSINPPPYYGEYNPNYGEFNPSMIPGRSSGYLERLRLIGGALPLNHEKLMFRELRHRLLDISYGVPTVNGASLPYAFDVDMFSDSNPKSTKLYEDDPVKHAYDTGPHNYVTQVARDKYIMESISRP